MKRNEAIEIARMLSSETKPLSVVYDRNLNDFFVSESEIFFIENGLEENRPYEIVAVYR